MLRATELLNRYVIHTNQIRIHCRAAYRVSARLANTYRWCYANVIHCLLIDGRWQPLEFNYTFEHIFNIRF